VVNSRDNPKTFHESRNRVTDYKNKLPLGLLIIIASPKIEGELLSLLSRYYLSDLE